MDLHIFSSGFKAVLGWNTVRLLRESVLRSKGSLFFSNFIGSSYLNSLPMVTYEGDNSVIT